MKKLLTIASVLLFTLNANAQWWGNNKVKGEGKVTVEDREVGNYDGVSLEGAINVVLISGKEGKISVKAESNLLDYIETEVSNDILKIKTKKGYSLKPSSGKKIVITVPVTSISKLALAGSGKLRSETLLEAASFKVSVAGSGDLEAEIEADTIKTSLAGSGNIQLLGKADEMKISIAGSGNLNASQMKVMHVSASVAGSGNATVHCEGSIKARIAGSGNLKYSGNPEIQDTKAVGSGKVIKI